MSTQPEMTFVLGAPGSGKGTLCKKLAALESSYHLSIGDHLRELRNSKSNPIIPSSDLSPQTLQYYLSNGELLPPNDIVSIIAAKISQEQKAGFQNFLVDGFPRDLPSAQHYDTVTTANSSSLDAAAAGAAGAAGGFKLPRVQRVLFFDCPKESALRRLVGRQRDERDNAGVFEERYTQFCRTNPEIVRFYGDCVVRVDTSGSADESMARLLAALGGRQKGRVGGGGGGVRGAL